jgi:arylsulfatase
VSAQRGNGVIIAMGGVTGGWSIYAKGGKPKFCYIFFGLEQYYVEGQQALPAGTHQVRMEFVDDGGGLAKGGRPQPYDQARGPSESGDGDPVGAPMARCHRPVLT